jgi:hypothetical protein
MRIDHRRLLAARLCGGEAYEAEELSLVGTKHRCVGLESVVDKIASL